MNGIFLLGDTHNRDDLMSYKVEISDINSKK